MHAKRHRQLQMKPCTKVDHLSNHKLVIISNDYTVMNVCVLGWKAIAVPGELHGLRTEYEHFGSGRLSWRQLLEPTIELLKRGVAVSSGLAITLKVESAISFT